MWYHDADRDGYGDYTDREQSCIAPNNHVTDYTDCDDTVYVINPAAIWYEDGDDDGFGDGSNDMVQCTDPGANHFVSSELVTNTHALTTIDDQLSAYWSFDVDMYTDISGNGRHLR
jgi:hypothetical protein